MNTPANLLSCGPAGKIFDSSGHRKVHTVKVFFWESNFVHESFIQSYDAFPTTYLILQI